MDEWANREHYHSAVNAITPCLFTYKTCNDESRAIRLQWLHSGDWRVVVFFGSSHEVVND